jgi:hypothetical protein
MVPISVRKRVDFDMAVAYVRTYHTVCRHLNWLRRSSDERRTKGKAKKWGPGELHEGSRFESILGANPWSAGQQNPETERPWFVVFVVDKTRQKWGSNLHSSE